MKSKRPLDVEEKTTIAALTASGRTINAVAETIGRDFKTVKKALQEPETQEQVENFQLILADQLQGKITMLLDGITPETISKMNALQSMTALGIATDKIRTIRNLSNVNLAMGVVITTNSPKLQKLLDEEL